MTSLQSAQHIAECIIENCPGKTLVLLSGGSSAKIGVKALELLPQEKRDEITISLTDERFVAFDSPDSNWNLLVSLGLKDLIVQKIPVLGQNHSTREQTSDDFRAALSTTQAGVQHTVAIFGIGTDNHVAGILPSSAAAKSSENVVTSYATDSFERITITPAFFASIDFAFLYAEGPDKATAVQLLSSPLDTVTYPAQLLKRAKKWEIQYNEEAL